MSWKTVVVAILISVGAGRESSASFLVASDFYGNMKRVDAVTGAITGTLAGGAEAGEIDVGPDGLVYASFDDLKQIRKINPVTGLSVGVIPLPGQLRDVTFGPDGQLYIALMGDAGGHGSIGIYRYNLVTQQLSSRFNTTTLNGTPIGIAFGPANDLFVCLDARFAGNGVHSVVRIAGQTGDVMGVVTTTQISIPQSIAFGPTGDFFVGNEGAGNVTQYHPNGAFVGVLSAGHYDTQGLYFLPDGDLVWGNGAQEFRRYDFTTGLETAFSTGYQFAMGMVLVPEPSSLFLGLSVSLILTPALRLRRR